MMTAHDFSGVFCAAATPFAEDGSPDHAAFAQHCHALNEEGCDGIALLGTTGEANSLGLEERQELLDRVIEAGIAPSRLVPGTAQTSVPDSVALTRHAVQAGVRAVVLLPPFYYKGASDEGLFRAYAETIERVADDRLRVILYHIPQISGVAISQQLIARLQAAYPGIVVGVKDSSGDLDNMSRTIAECPDCAVMAGADPLMLPLLQSGGAGCITASSNLVASDLRIVFDGWADPAREAEVAAAQARINAWRELTNAYVQLPTVKTMLARRRGWDGWTRVRPPFVELDDEARASVWAQMEQLEQGEKA
ncbi:dihydrodipicolinate synthase family protein [Halomonas sp. NO4]|uniref:dihydrodipicolinate synthase family protein n=1 Tax=Halomonas sp. NO4 TaxID=2484813 RepID=UPI001969EEBC|nr:dihydrodipicolinate synthase family protein [Halomonas sp. NO4]